MFSSAALAQPEQGTRIGVQNAQISLPRREIQVKAHELSYEDNFTVLKGHVAITSVGQDNQPTSIGSETASVETELTEVQITLNHVSQFPEESLNQLVSLLKAAAQSPKFRVHSSESFGMSGHSVDVLYDRRAGTLKYHYVGGWGDIIQVQEDFYSGVSDRAMVGIALDNDPDLLSQFHTHSPEPPFIFKRGADAKATSLPGGMKRRTLRVERYHVEQRTLRVERNQRK